MNTTEQIKIKHFIPVYSNKGGITVAYFRPKGNEVMELSVAICSKNDQYCKSTGRFHALRKFMNKETILLPIEKDDNSVNFLNDRFEGYVNNVNLTNI